MHHSHRFSELAKKVKSLITNEGLDTVIADFAVVRFGDVDDIMRHGDLTRSLMQTSQLAVLGGRHLQCHFS